MHWRDTLKVGSSSSSGRMLWPGHSFSTARVGSPNTPALGLAHHSIRPPTHGAGYMTANTRQLPLQRAVHSKTPSGMP